MKPWKHLAVLALMACNTQSIVGIKPTVDDAPPPNEELMCTFRAPDCEAIVIPSAPPFADNPYVGAVEQSCTPQVRTCDDVPIDGVPCDSESLCNEVANGNSASFVSGCRLSSSPTIASLEFDEADIHCSFLRYNLEGTGSLSFIDSELENVELFIEANPGTQLYIDNSRLTNVDIQILGTTELVVTDDSILDNVRVNSTNDTIVSLRRGTTLVNTNILTNHFDIDAVTVSDSILRGEQLNATNSEFSRTHINSKEVSIDGGSIDGAYVVSTLANFSNIASPSTIEGLHFSGCRKATISSSDLKRSFLTGCESLSLIGTRVDDSILGSVELERSEIFGSILYDSFFRGRVRATSSTIAASAMCGVVSVEAEATEFDCFSCNISRFATKTVEGISVNGSGCDALADT